MRRSYSTLTSPCDDGNTCWPSAVFAVDRSIRREELLASLTKERDAVVKAKKEIKAKFDAVDVYLIDFAKVG